MRVILAEALKLKLFRSLDVQFAQMLATDKQSALMLVIACLSADTNRGNVCLPLRMLNQAYLFNGLYPALARQAWKCAGYPTLETWIKLLLQSSAVSDGSYNTPLVLDNKCLYMQRMWLYERTIVNFLTQTKPIREYNALYIKKILEHYFPNKQNNSYINLQRIAAATIITRNFTFVFGIPKIDKISIIIKILLILLKLKQKSSLDILITALYSRTAIELANAVEVSIKHNSIHNFKKKIILNKVITLCSLLKNYANKKTSCYYSNNLLDIDIIIIDDASVINMPTMANLISILPSHVQIIIFSDYPQFVATETAAMLGNIFRYTNLVGYSNSRHQELQYLTGYKLVTKSNIKYLQNKIISTNVNKNYLIKIKNKYYDIYHKINTKKNNIKYNVADSCYLLEQNDHTNGSNITISSSIRRLADYINKGDITNALTLIKSNASTEISYNKLNLTYKDLLQNTIVGYQKYLTLILKLSEPMLILKQFNNFRVLCVLREGLYGSTYLSYLIEQSLKNACFLNQSTTSYQYNYIGKPIIIKKNTPLLDLYNGDIGILLLNNRNKLRAYFLLPSGNIKDISIDRLPEHEISFAVTIHHLKNLNCKHNILILPNQRLPILTRELLYSAVIHTQERLSIYANDDIIKYAILNKIKQRNSLMTQLL